MTGLYAPAETPPRLVSRLQAEVAKVMREPSITARMEQLGMIMEEDGTASNVEFERYSAIARKPNLQLKCKRKTGAQLATMVRA